jgi:hypothetical protein
LPGFKQEFKVDNTFFICLEKMNLDNELFKWFYEHTPLKYVDVATYKYPWKFMDHVRVGKLTVQGDWLHKQFLPAIRYTNDTFTALGRKNLHFFLNIKGPPIKREVLPPYY